MIFRQTFVRRLCFKPEYFHVLQEELPASADNTLLDLHNSSDDTPLILSLMIQQLKKNIKCDSEPKAGKGSEKWVKSREMSQISKWNGLPEGLRVLEVTYHFKVAEHSFGSL